MSNPGKEHWIAIKRVLRYLHVTLDYAICYLGTPEANKVIDVQGFVDAKLLGDLVHKWLCV
jgi:hypothetical protein